jgi:hypothetical protein
MKKAKAKRRLSKRSLRLALLLLIILVGVVLALSHEWIRQAYYKHKVTTALNSENKKLVDPLTALGFKDVKYKTECSHYPKYGYDGTPLTCSAEMQSYMVFDTQASKDQAVSAAEKISALLKQNGWQQGNYELGKWFKDNTSGIDYNPDAYHYKTFGNIFCMFDFFEAYSNPKPPAASAEFRCTSPKDHPPGVD